MADTLLISHHVSYIQKLGQSQDELAYHLTSHLRLNAIYWGLTAVCIMGHSDALSREEMVAFVMDCWDDNAGGFGAHPGHDAHLLSTLSAIQILIMQDALDKLDIDRVVSFILSLQQPSGVFAGDSWGEIDTRFLYCAVNALSLLGKLELLDKKKTVGYIKRCRNFDGGFGSCVGVESHAGQGRRLFISAFQHRRAISVPMCCRASDTGQTRHSRLQHSWLVVMRAAAAQWRTKWPTRETRRCLLQFLGPLVPFDPEQVDADKLTKFILSAQDPEGGGIADRLGNMVDVFHTNFGTAGLSLLGYPGLVDLDPVYCMPAILIEKMGSRKGWKALERRQITSK